MSRSFRHREAQAATAGSSSVVQKRWCEGRSLLCWDTARPCGGVSSLAAASTFGSGDDDLPPPPTPEAFSLEPQLQCAFRSDPLLDTHWWVNESRLF